MSEGVRLKRKQEQSLDFQFSLFFNVLLLLLCFSETAAQYEARIAVLQSHPVEWRRGSAHSLVSVQPSVHFLICLCFPRHS